MADDKKCFTAEEIAKSLRACSDGGNPCDGCTVYGRGIDACHGILAAAADLIEAQAKRIMELEEQLRWVPTSERLPELDDGVFLIDGEMSAVQVLVMVEGAKLSTTLCFDGEDFFDYAGGELIPYQVTHWKPMPKGPEVGHD